MAPIKLYYALGSPAARSTLITIAALGLEVEKIEVDIRAGDTRKPEYLKKNPLHTVPTLEDGDFAIFDSHAINAYLVSKYGKDDSLYPKDLQKRAIVDQRLHFDNGVLFPGEVAILRSIFGGNKTIEPHLADNLKGVYQSLETLLDGHNYAAGDDLTIADFSLATTLSNAVGLVPVDKATFPKITAWLERLDALPYFKSNNDEGAKMFRGFCKQMLS